MKTLNVESGAKRGELWMLLPQDIVVVPEENVGRPFGFTFHDLVVKILESGKVEVPLKARKIHDNKVQLTFGYRRHKAASFINEHLEDGELIKVLVEAGYTEERALTMTPPEPIRVPVIVENINAREAFFKNFSENYDRVNVSVVGAARIARQMKNYGGTDEEICLKFGTTQPDGTVKAMSPAWLSQLWLVLQLDDQTQQELDREALSASSAYFLAGKIPEMLRRPVVEKAKEIAAKRVEQIETQAEEPAPNNLVEMPAPVESKPAPKKKVASPKKKPATKKAAQVTHSDVVKAARQLGVLDNKTVARKMKDVRELLQKYQGPGASTHCRKFCAAFEKFIDGEPGSEELMDKEFGRRFKE
jgi:ParB-like chromosome segregation protein Spo0J